MFNTSYQARATRQGRAERDALREAGGGHKAAVDASLRLPWAGIFEPWRPFVLTAMAADAAILHKSPSFKKRGRKARTPLPGQMDLFPLAELMPEAYETIEV